MATIRRSFALAVNMAGFVIALGAGPPQSGSVQSAEIRASDVPRYLEGIDRGDPPPALTPLPAAPIGEAPVPQRAPSAYAWGPPTLGSTEPAAGQGMTGADDDAWSLHCQERVCFVQYVPSDFETVSSRRFAVNLGWSPSVGQFELEVRFLVDAIGAEIRAISVDSNGRRMALLPFVRCNERGTCWYRALLADEQVERLTNALVLALVSLETHEEARGALQVSAVGLRGAFARLLEAAPEAVSARRRVGSSPPAATPPAAYTSPALDESRGLYLPRITGPTR